MIKNEFELRYPGLEDIPFLVKTIVEAEKSGTSIFTYSTIFGLSEEDARSYITKMLEEEIDGCELSISSFIIAEKEGKIVGAVGAWFEGSEGIPSNQLKGNLLSYILPQACLERARSLGNIVGELHIEYIKDTIQIGLVYVAPEARGKGLVQILIGNRIEMIKKKHPMAKEAYIQVFGNNIPAIRAYEKVGFEIIYKKEAASPRIKSFMPDSTKVLMRKYI